MTTPPSGRKLGRYLLYDQFAAGGTASVHLGRLASPVGFSRRVAIKQLHPAFAADRRVRAMLVDEARIAAHLHHGNIVPTLDAVIRGSDVYVIMEYVHGESLAELLRAGPEGPLAPHIASSILCGALRGLHAAHTAKDPGGEPLEIVHRDVSPQNILVGVDGAARLIDFGIAKARARIQTTADRSLRGKLCYLAPEQLRGEGATRLSDVYAAGVVLWEVMTGRRPFDGDCEGSIIEQILVGWVDPPSKFVPELPDSVDRIILRALETSPARRFDTAEEMAEALESALPPAPVSEVAAWVLATAGEALRARNELLQRMDEADRAPHRLRSPPPRHAALAALLTAVCGAAAVGVTDPGGPPLAALQTSPGTAAPHAFLTGDVSPEARSATDTLATDRPARAPATGETRADEMHTLERAARASIRKIARAEPAPEAPGTADANVDACEPGYAVNPDGIRIYDRRCLEP